MDAKALENLASPVVWVPVTHAKIFGWYDNEYGSDTKRLGDLTVFAHAIAGLTPRERSPGGRCVPGRYAPGDATPGEADWVPAPEAASCGPRDLEGHASCSSMRSAACSAIEERGMRVKVELLGVLRPADGRWEESVDLEVRDDVTVGELLSALAERFGRPFRELAEASDGRLPRHVRMFACSEMLVARNQRVASAAGAPDAVSVVFLSPMMGG